MSSARSRSVSWVDLFREPPRRPPPLGRLGRRQSLAAAAAPHHLSLPLAAGRGCCREAPRGPGDCGGEALPLVGCERAMRGWCSPPRSSPATPPPALLLRQGFSAARRPGLYSRGADLAAPPLRPARRWLGARHLLPTLLLLLRRPSKACRPDPGSMGADLAGSPPLCLAVPVAAALGHATAGRGPALSACASRRRGRVRPAPRCVWATGAVGVRLPLSRHVAAAGGAVGGFYSALRPAFPCSC